MTDQSSVFNAVPATNVTPDPATTAVIPSTASLTLPPEVQGLVGPGKKYATLEDALKSIPHAQAHIARLEEENKSTRDKVAALEVKVQSVDEILAKVSANPDSSDLTAVDEDTVANRVLNKLNLQEREKQVTANLNKANDLLVQKEGSIEAAAQAFVNKAAELGISVTTLKNIAAESPAAFMQYFDKGTPVTNPKNAPPKGTINTASLNPNAGAPEVGSAAWHAQQRKEKGDSWYFSPEQTKQRFDDAKKLGKDKYMGHKSK